MSLLLYKFNGIFSGRPRHKRLYCTQDNHKNSSSYKKSGGPCADKSFYFKFFPKIQKKQNKKEQHKYRSCIDYYLYCRDKLRVQEEIKPCNMEEKQKHPHNTVHGVPSGYYNHRKKNYNSRKISEKQFRQHGNSNKGEWVN